MMTTNECYDYVESTLNMLEFITSEGNSFAFSYSYLLCWELKGNETLVLNFMGHEVTVTGKNLKSLTEHISKCQMKFLGVHTDPEGVGEEEVVIEGIEKSLNEN